MPDLQPGEANVFFEIHFDKLAPSVVRSALAAQGLSLIDLIVPVATRNTWLNRAYSGDGSAASTLDYVEKLFETVNPNLVPMPTPQNDAYCWLGNTQVCYTYFTLNNSGVKVTLSVDVDGYVLECDLLVVMANLPPSS